MQYNPGPAGRRPLQDEVTVHIPDEVTVHLPDGPNGAKPPDGVTALVPGAMLAPAPTPEGGHVGDGPVFVNNGGGRKRLMRLAGLLIALLSIGFLAIIGVALAVPNVATSVGLGDVVPYVVPGAAAVQAPMTSAPPTPPPVQPKPTPKPQVAAERTNTERNDVEPTATVAPTVEPTATATATVAPTATQPASTQTPPTQTAPTGGNNPPVVDVSPGSGQAAQN